MTELQRLRDDIAAEVFPCRSTVHSAEDNLGAIRRAFRELRGEGHRLQAKLRRTADELERTKSELHRPRSDGLSVGEHIALVQRAQGIAKTDHAELVRAQRELANSRAELKRLQRRARRRAPATGGRRGRVRMRGGRR